jgi:hypothetical protein
VSVPIVARAVREPADKPDRERRPDVPVPVAERKPARS